MPEREILQLGNPVLVQVCAPVQDVRASAVRSLTLDLSDTLAAFRSAAGYGRGIAAPQVGALQRVLFIRMQPAGFTSPLYNPRIVSRSAKTFQLWDDCFSFPELLVRVERAAEIQVEYLDEHGVPQSLHAQGDLSELIQHEIDHLDGILAVQRAISPQAFTTRSEWERRHRR